MPQAVQVDCPELILKDPYDLVLGRAGKTEGKFLHFRGNFNMIMSSSTAICFGDTGVAVVAVATA